MWSDKTFAVFITVLSGVGTLTNFTSYKYLTQNFDTKINVFSILSQDALANGFCSGLYFVTNTINLVDENSLRNNYGCNIFCLGLMVPSLLGPWTSLMISLRRFVQLTRPTLFQDDCKIINRNVSIGIVVVFGYCLAHLFWRENEFTELCLGETEKEEFFTVSFFFCESHSDEPNSTCHSLGQRYSWPS